jgi:uncharacterized membrane protein YdcZ (DUF606 family)
VTITTLLTNEITNDPHAKAISAWWALFVFAALVGGIFFCHCSPLLAPALGLSASVAVVQS